MTQTKGNLFKQRSAEGGTISCLNVCQKYSLVSAEHSCWIKPARTRVPWKQGVKCPLTGGRVLSCASSISPVSQEWQHSTPQRCPQNRDCDATSVFKNSCPTIRDDSIPQKILSHGVYKYTIFCVYKHFMAIIWASEGPCKMGSARLMFTDKRTWAQQGNGSLGLRSHKSVRIQTLRNTGP